jgi:hypothetical protein
MSQIGPTDLPEFDPNEIIDADTAPTGDALNTIFDIIRVAHNDTDSKLSNLTPISVNAVNITGLSGSTLYAQLTDLHSKVMLKSTYDTNNSGSVDLAENATKLQTARKITIGGDASGSALFDGSQDIQINVTGIGGGSTTIPDGSVTTTKLANGAVTGAKLASNSVSGSTHIVGGSVQTAQLADGAVTMAKLDPAVINAINSGGSGGSGDMLKSVYDTNNNGVVDQAAKLQVPHTISITGDAVSAGGPFDGTANLALNITIPNATATTKGAFSAADKSKLDGIADGATNYSHPASHPAAMITTDPARRFVTDAEKAAWNSGTGGGGGGSFTIKRKSFTALSGQTVFDISSVGSYVPGTNVLTVYVNGIPQFSGVGLTETSSTTFTLTSAAAVGSVVRVFWFEGTISAVTIQRKSFIATAGQTAFDISSAGSYTPGANRIEVYVDKVIQFSGVGYIETSGTIFTLTSGAAAGQIVQVKWFV